jgi:flavodoxin
MLKFEVEVFKSANNLANKRYLFFGCHAGLYDSKKFCGVKDSLIEVTSGMQLDGDMRTK